MDAAAEIEEPVAMAAPPARSVRGVQLVFAASFCVTLATFVAWFLRTH
jgi:hypothetical protein